MGKCYVELRKSNARGNGLSTDMMRHLHTRQYLGRAVVISSYAPSMLSAARKQWLKLSRYVQNQRAATLDADKILKYTHTVTHMQHIRFTAKQHPDDPGASVYFISPESIATIPLQCLSVYVTTALSDEQIHSLLDHLPDEALIIDYTHQHWEHFGVRPKTVLEAEVTEQWQQVETFLDTYHINIKRLYEGIDQDVEAMEEALDVLLGASRTFLEIAGRFQRSLEVARPLRLGKALRRQYDAVSLLAHRVQALSTDSYTGQFLETYNEDDSFFLYDPGRELLLATNLAETIARHMQAGRFHLAKALQQHPSQLGYRQLGSHKLLPKTQTV